MRSKCLRSTLKVPYGIDNALRLPEKCYKKCLISALKVPLQCLISALRNVLTSGPMEIPMASSTSRSMCITLFRCCSDYFCLQQAPSVEFPFESIQLSVLPFPSSAMSSRPAIKQRSISLQDARATFEVGPCEEDAQTRMDSSLAKPGISHSASVGGSVSGGEGNLAAADFDIEAAAGGTEHFVGEEQEAEEELLDFIDDEEVCPQDPASRAS